MRPRRILSRPPYSILKISSYSYLPRRVGIFAHALGRVGLAIDGGADHDGSIGCVVLVGRYHHLPLQIINSRKWKMDSKEVLKDAFRT